MKLEEFYIAANQDHNELIGKGATDRTILEEFLFLHKRIKYFERRYELLKEEILKRDIKGSVDDLELKRHKTVSYEYNEEESLYKQLVELKTESKLIESQLKQLPSTEKITKITTKVENK